MSARARAALGERDANHAEIVKAYESLYCQTFDTWKVGGGYPDLNVRIPTRRGAVICLVEIKMPDGTPNEAQKRFARDWPVMVVRSAEDVARHVALVQNRERYPERLEI